MKNRKGQISLYLVFIIAAIVGILVFAVFIPAGIEFTSAMFLEGQNIIIDSNETIAGISDATTRTAVQAVLTGASTSTTDHITILSNMFQYAWVLVIGLVALVIFVYTRRLVEYGGGVV